MNNNLALSLPPELFSRIFIIKLWTEQPEFGLNRIPTPKYSEWYNMLPVCKYWYSIAINVPHLWNFISSSLPPQHARLLLARSKQVPIRVQPTGASNRPRVQDAQSLAFILKESRRIQQLYLMIDENIATMFRTHRLQLPLPLPLIQALHVDNRIEDDRDVDATVKASIFPFYDMPRLHTLYIAGYKLADMKHLLQPTLRAISLMLYDETADEDDEDNDMSPPISEILNLLRDMPLLEEIDIPTWLGNETPLPPNFPVISFQHLRILQLQLNLPDTNFLKHLSFPPDIRLQISVQCLNLDGDAFQSSFEHCVRACGLAFPGSAGKATRALELTQSPHWTFTAKCWLADGEFDAERVAVKGNRTPELELDFEYSTGCEVLEIYEVVGQCLDVSSVELLSLSLAPAHQEWWSGEAVLTICQSFNNMQRLKVLAAIAWPLSYLCAVLCYPPGDAVLPTTPLFPALKELYAPYLTQLSTTNNMLLDLVDGRKAIAAPISQIHVWKDNFDDGSLPSEPVDWLGSLDSVIVVQEEMLSLAPLGMLSSSNNRVAMCSFKSRFLNDSPRGGEKQLSGGSSPGPHSHEIFPFCVVGPKLSFLLRLSHVEYRI